MDQEERRAKDWDSYTQARQDRRPIGNVQELARYDFADAGQATVFQPGGGHDPGKRKLLFTIQKLREYDVEEKKLNALNVKNIGVTSI